jgi:peroxiredoxin
MKSAICVLAAMLVTAAVPQVPANQAPAAPEFAEGKWLNVQEGKPVTLASRRGKPTLVAFWTFACSNCHANFAPYERLLKTFRPKGVELLSIHTPELRVERDIEEVKKEVSKRKIDYPVLIDNDFANWKRWNNTMWPSLYVLDGEGRIRYRWIGELNWNGQKGEANVASVLNILLNESRRR